MVSNLYVRQVDLKIILELTGSQCSSERRAVTSCCERLGETTQATEVCMMIMIMLRQFINCGTRHNSLLTHLCNDTCGSEMAYLQFAASFANE